MQNIRTDLAVESRPPQTSRGEDDGIKTETEQLLGFELTSTKIYKGRGEELSGRKAGLYLTLKTGKLWLETEERRHSAALAVRELLERLMPKGAERFLVVGLGNREITPDSIGPKTVDKLIITHHMRRLRPSLYSALSFGDMAAVVPGVLGQTGVESAVLVKAAAECISPDCLIAVDALAARSLSRLATTVQLTCTGIAPGSGVCNSREELSEETVGCPVIAIGVPTVVDAPTLVLGLGGSADEESDSFFVTPKENDVMIRVVAEVVSTAINYTVHRRLEGLEEYKPL